MKTKFLILLGIIFCNLFAEINPEIEVAFKTNRYDKTIYLAKLYLPSAQESDFSQIYYYLGASYAALKRPGLSDACFKEYFKTPFNLEEGYKIAAYYEVQEKSDLAITAYENILKTNPDEKRAAISLGNLYFKKARYQETIDTLQAIIKANPKQANPLAYNIGVSYFVLKDNNNAEKYLRMALDDGYIEPDVYFKIGKVSLNKGLYRRSIDELLQGVKLANDNVPANVYSDLGLAYEKLTETKMAEEAYRRAIEVGGESVGNYIGFSNNALKNKNFADVMSILEPKINMYDNYSDYLYNLALGCEYNNEPDKAITYYQKVINVDPGKEEEVRKRLDNLTARGNVKR